jgi:nicotinamidase-related amidase
MKSAFELNIPQTLENVCDPQRIAVGVATEVGIDPTVRHGADLRYIPVIVTDAWGAGNGEAAKQSIEGLKFTGDAVETNTETICATLRRRPAFVA